MAFPKDIYTEPSEVDPDTLANLGPLRRLAGIWEGTKGSDTSPKEEGPETRTFSERIEIQPIDPQTNGPQLFYGLRYHTQIRAEGEDFLFHNQLGFWLWEPATGLVIQTLAIPRGQIAMASGHATPDATSLSIKAVRGQTDYGICSTAFLEHAFQTDSYQMDINFHDNGSWSYVLQTILTVKGLAEPFTHRDSNMLKKVAEPQPNPAMQK